MADEFQLHVIVVSVARRNGYDALTDLCRRSLRRGYSSPPSWDGSGRSSTGPSSAVV